MFFLWCIEYHSDIPWNYSYGTGSIGNIDMGPVYVTKEIIKKRTIFRLIWINIIFYNFNGS